MAADEHVGAEVEILLDAVACDSWRESRPQSVPNLGFFAPGINLLDLHRVHGKQEGRGQAGPERVAAEVGSVQRIPMRAHVVSRKGRARVLSFRDDTFVRGDNGNALGTELAVLAALSERLDGGLLMMQGNPQCSRHVILIDALQRPAVAARRNRDGEALAGIPSVQASMGLNSV